MIRKANISRIIQSRITLAAATLAIVVLASLDVMYAALYSVLDYDLGKVIAYIDLYPGLMNYIENLRFGQGIAIQIYLLNQIVPVTPAILKLCSYFFFVGALTAASVQARGRQDGTINTFIVTTLAALGIILFLQSSVLRYLGSYGMLVYCQSFFISALFLYFLRKHLFSDSPGDFS